MSLSGNLLGNLTSLQKGRSRRISSNEQPNWNDGNFDSTRLAPGDVFELPRLEGPGLINHIWFTSHAGGYNELNSLTLRIYWDDRQVPGVEVPLGEFFGVGQRPTALESLPVQVSPTGSLTCYWQMPFAKSARIVVSNDNLERTSGLYWQVDWVELDALPSDILYFHARYRQEYPALMGQDYLIADLEGQGQYVGTVMTITSAQPGWFGEGDDFFYIDGERIPSLQGTGSEDYFNDAWGFRPRTSLWFGQPNWQGWATGDTGTCYRWHVLDPVRFQKSLKLTMEHKGNEENAVDGWYIERPDFFSSVAFWYQRGEPKPFGDLPSWKERCVPWQNHNLVRTYLKAASDGNAKLAVKTEGFFGGRPALYWANTEPNASLHLPFTLAEAGNFAVRLIAYVSAANGTFDIKLDGMTVREAVDFSSRAFVEIDLLIGTGSEVDIPLGTHTLSAGDHTLSFQALPVSDGRARPLSVEVLRLLKLPPKAERKIKNQNEANYVRIGIGRAIYAYRLAHGVLPGSLQVLVESGFMLPRYLKDENGYPFKSYVEGDYLVVESSASPGWTHRWQGLDARR
jgi:hypothetical protein